MKRFSIFVNNNKDENFKVTIETIKAIKELGANYYLEENVIMALGEEFRDLKGDMLNTDVVVCIGGDGTFLGVSRLVHNMDVLMVGINLGKLGFLTEINQNEIKNSFKKIMDGEYFVEERMMLNFEIIRNNKVIASDIALNDVVVSKGNSPKILHTKIYINNNFVEAIPGDGLIVSSPTGSTAYSLSAGGPIIEPDVEMIVFTPICPHVLCSRSTVTNGDRVIKIEIDEKYDYVAQVSVDGEMGYGIFGKDIVEIKKAKHKIKIIRFNNTSFFDILRDKIYDRGENLRK